MTHQKPAGLAPALGIVRPVIASPVTLEPCTKCKITAVCMPVTGKHGRRAYPYCVERCWPLARAASETLVKAAPAARRPSMRCSCCGEFGHARPVILNQRITGLYFCEANCWSERLATLDRVPACRHCDKYLQPHEYTNQKCGVCQ